MNKTKLHIKGMHCVSCEVLLEKEFKKLKVIKSCKVNHKKGYAEIECDGEVPLNKLKNIARESGYELLDEPHPGHINSESGRKIDYFQIILIIIFLSALFLVLKKFDLTRFFPNSGSQINVFIALLLGIVASVSTCLAITGGIVMSFGMMVNVDNGREHNLLSRAMPHIFFHAGRIGGFMILGGLLGLIGSKINYSPSFTGYLTILISLVMVYVGLQVLGVVPNITKLGFHLPKSLSGGIHSLEKNTHYLAPIVIGILTFFLPCGFTQSMQLAAVVSGSFVSGALIMGAFALGTMPVLLSIGVGATYAKKEKMKFFTNIIGVLVVFFALYSFNSGLVLAGSLVTIDFWNKGGASAVSQITDNVQVVKMDVDWVFEPNEFRVKKGIPVRWEITGVNVSGCSSEVIIPTLNIRKKINIGLNLVEFTPVKEGVIQFSCGMGMLTGQFIITD